MEFLSIRDSFYQSKINYTTHDEQFSKKNFLLSSEEASGDHRKILSEYSVHSHTRDEQGFILENDAPP